MMYLYVGSIVAIMCIYITVLLDNCTSFGGGGGGGRARGGGGSKKPHKSIRAGDPETGSVGSGFGTLRRAHIDRTKVSRTSFYLRVGALGKHFEGNHQHCDIVQMRRPCSARVRAYNDN